MIHFRLPEAQDLTTAHASQASLKVTFALHNGAITDLEAYNNFIALSNIFKQKRFFISEEMELPSLVYLLVESTKLMRSFSTSINALYLWRRKIY